MYGAVEQHRQRDELPHFRLFLLVENSGERRAAKPAHAPGRVPFPGLRWPAASAPGQVVLLLLDLEKERDFAADLALEAVHEGFHLSEIEFGRREIFVLEGPWELFLGQWQIRLFKVWQLWQLKGKL